ncbi:hypothetical protein RDWZM_008458 [Blomia tropicalis]|uniref:Glycosyl hydrolase family 13 catalytic domain-containing protein n=1 Tax=Blomia tropicalis TaxID=40697 RepID=A0A9Q0RLF7_BLOTA|nr:hypothetical protein RDWZM_008458 [Blomia tropicalis]
MNLNIDSNDYEHNRRRSSIAETAMTSNLLYGQYIPPTTQSESSSSPSQSSQQSQQRKEVSFLELVEVSTTDPSIGNGETKLTFLSGGGHHLDDLHESSLNFNHQSMLQSQQHGSLHYERLRPPAAMMNHQKQQQQQQQQTSTPAIQHQSSSSGNSSNSPRHYPRSSITSSNGITGVSQSHPLPGSPLMAPLSSLPPSSGTYPIFQTNSSHLFAPNCASPQLVQFASSTSSPMPFYGNGPYEAIGPSPLTELCQSPNTAILSETVISKSSSSDSDTNDSGTRLISDSLADIAGAASHPIYLTSSQSDPVSASIITNRNISSQFVGQSFESSVDPNNLFDTTLKNNNNDNNCDNNRKQSLDRSTESPNTNIDQLKSDALWIQMQSDLSKEIREKYLSINSGSSSNGRSLTKKKKKINNGFTFRRIGSSKYGFMCPLKRSAQKRMMIAIFVMLIGTVGLFLSYCYWNGFGWFGRSTTRNYGPDPAQYWWQGTTFYEIFPASFKDSDGDGFGDLRGITQNVAYLRSLGISAIRLSPIYAANDYPQRFDNVLNFIEVLHTNQIRVILDLNPTITSDQHPWSTHRTLNRTGEYAYYYENRSTIGQASATFELKNKAEETKQTSIDVQDNDSETTNRRAPIHLEETQFYFGAGLRLNWSHDAVRNELLNVATFWLQHVDGLYLSNMHQIYLEPNLPGAYSRIAIVHDFLRKLRSKVSEMNRNVGSSHLKGHRSRKILICSSTFMEPFLNGIKRRRSSKDQHRVGNRFKPEFDDFDLNQPIMDSDLDATILADLHVMPYNAGNSNSGSSSSSSSSSNNSSQRLKQKIRSKTKKIYSYFDLVHFELNVLPSETDTIREQVNYVFLNRPDDFPTILWSIGSIHQSRLSDRLGEYRSLAGHFLLTMMPGSVSILYGDEIGLGDVYDTHTHNYEK